MTEVTSPRVFIRHVRAARLCTKGGRAWFASYGLSWTNFLKEGIDIATLEATGDPLAARAIAKAREEADGRR